MAKYFCFLRSKKKDRLGPEILREFGGSLGRSLEYSSNTVKLEADHDEEAMRAARRIARKSNMFLLRIEKVIYERKAPLPSEH